ncbi:MAG: hypothetical protein ABL986_17295 [Vicinamibacterales bacterium]
MAQATAFSHEGPPSARRLVSAMLVALVVAALVLVGAVMPAEYGVDPLGTGKAMGLLALSSVPESTETTPEASAGSEGTPVQSGPVALYSVPYRTDSVELIIGPYEFVEYKYRLEKGASMLYAWAATAPLVHDMHGEPDGAAKDYSESFDKQTRGRADGAFVAPFSGIHGWFWENPAGEPVTVTLASSGFYTTAVEIRSDRTRTPHTLRSVSPSTRQGESR